MDQPSDQPTNQELLREYVEHRSQPAFEKLVRRHIDPVYSAALRAVRNNVDLAEDVTQSAFMALAVKAHKLVKHPLLSGWLHRTAYNLALKAVRSEVRRRAREKVAAYASVHRAPADPTEAGWEDVAPHLDAALDRLSEADRGALFLRYFERKSAQEIGRALGINEEAAQKRVKRAVERLREILVRRDVQVGAGALIALLAANAVRPAPPALAGSVGEAAASPTAAVAAAGRRGTSLSRPGRPALALGALLLFLGSAAVLVWRSREEVDPGIQPQPPRRSAMRIQIASVMVDDQERARSFYTGALGLVVKVDVAAGGARWLTVVSPQDPDGAELLLEPIGLPAAATYQKQLFDAGIPLTAFAVGNVRREYERMSKAGVTFRGEPAAAGQTTIAIFEDTCGNLIQIFEEQAGAGAGAASGVRIRQTSVMVEDQDRALEVYTEKLGFLKKRDLPANGGRRLTVVSPARPEGTELLLDPMAFPPARVFQRAVRDAGIPHTAFVTADVQAEYERLKGLGVAFQMPPTKAEGTTMAVFDDTCGNFIMMFEG